MWVLKETTNWWIPWEHLLLKTFNTTKSSLRCKKVLITKSISTLKKTSTPWQCSASLKLTKRSFYSHPASSARTCLIVWCFSSSKTACFPAWSTPWCSARKMKDLVSQQATPFSSLSFQVQSVYILCCTQRSCKEWISWNMLITKNKTLSKEVHRFLSSSGFCNSWHPFIVKALTAGYWLSKRRLKLLSFISLHFMLLWKFLSFTLRRSGIIILNLFVIIQLILRREV